MFKNNSRIYFFYFLFLVLVASTSYVLIGKEINLKLTLGEWGSILLLIVFSTILVYVFSRLINESKSIKIKTIRNKNLLGDVKHP